MDGSWSIKVNNHKLNHLAFQTATFVPNAVFLLEKNKYYEHLEHN